MVLNPVGGARAGGGGSAAGSLEEEKARAQRVLDSYLEFVNSDRLATEGVAVTRLGQPSAGRVLFSLRDLPLRTPYVTAHGVTMERASADTVLLNGTVRLHVFDPRQPVAALPRDSSLSDLDRPARAPDDAPGAPQAARSQRAGAQTERYGRFAYLESHEYLMYNTYDVHFYASFALAMLWPHLELSLQRDVARAALAQYSEKWLIMGSGELGYRKLRGAVPHDLGTPSEEPWARVNAYNVQDVSNWKDLNSKFVLQVYRDWIATGDDDFLHDQWEVVKELMHFLSLFDHDGDCMIENEGFPDQTYDAWSVRGVSAYSGGLWLAALHATAHMAEVIAETKAAGYYRSVLYRAQRVFEAKLWTGAYYKYDEGAAGSSLSIMADQLCGHWYARACGLPALHPDANVRSALLSVYNNNVMRFRGGQAGAVNGMRPDGAVDGSSMQSAEVWTGTTYAVAAAMLQEGLVQEAWQTAHGVHKVTYEAGYWFQTPEAWDGALRYRAIAYMRPLSVWALKWAWERRADRAVALTERAQLAFTYRKDERKLKSAARAAKRDEAKRKKLQERLHSTRTLLDRYESDPDFRSDSSGRDESSERSAKDKGKDRDVGAAPAAAPAAATAAAPAAATTATATATASPVAASAGAVGASGAEGKAEERRDGGVSVPAPEPQDEQADSANSSVKEEDSAKEKR